MPIKKKYTVHSNSTKNRMAGNTAHRSTSVRPRTGSKHKSTSNSNYYSGETIPISGILEVMPDFGVIRQDDKISDDLPKDVYTSPSQIRHCNLRMGDFVTGFANNTQKQVHQSDYVRIRR